MLAREIDAAALLLLDGAARRRPMARLLPRRVTDAPAGFQVVSNTPAAVFGDRGGVIGHMRPAESRDCSDLGFEM